MSLQPEDPFQMTNSRLFHIHRSDAKTAPPAAGDMLNVVRNRNDYTRALEILTHRHRINGKEVGVNEVAGALWRSLEGNQDDARRGAARPHGEAHRLLPLVLGALLKGFEDHLRIVRELVFEDIRVREFPHRPSRTNCYWALPPQEEIALIWLQRMRNPQGTLCLVETEGKVHAADAKLVRIGCYSLEELQARSRAYWKGADPDTSLKDVEYLVEGPLRVIETRGIPWVSRRSA